MRFQMVLYSVDVQPVRYDPPTIGRSDIYAGTVTLDVDTKKPRSSPLVVDTMALQSLVLPLLTNKVGTMITIFFALRIPIIQLP